MIFVTFFLNDVHYALDVAYVEEVIPLPEITPVAKLPPRFRGMINLRGTAVPIMDLRACLGMAVRSDALETDIIIIKMSGKIMGLIVDKVLNVIEIQADQCMPPPELSDDIDLKYIARVAQLGSEFVSLIQIDAIFEGAEKEAFLQSDLQSNEV